MLVPADVVLMGVPEIVTFASDPPLNPPVGLVAVPPTKGPGVTFNVVFGVSWEIEPRLTLPLVKAAQLIPCW